MPHPLAPSGTLRAVVNRGNAVLAPAAGGGVAEAVLRGLAARLGVPVALAEVGAAPLAVAALEDGRADASVLAVDPGRAVDFSAPLLAIEGGYAVPEGSPLRALAEVDRPGIRIVVGRGSAYDLHLTRSLRHATLLRAPDSASVARLRAETGAEVAAGLRPTLAATGLRVLPGAFMSIRQALAVPAGRGAALAGLVPSPAEVAALVAAEGAAATALEER